MTDGQLRDPRFGPVALMAIDSRRLAVSEVV
jgi:hypothetical protein